MALSRAEDAAGPTTTCEIATFDSEPHLELNFDSSKTSVFPFSVPSPQFANKYSSVLKIILKSSWLRDALSELDPSCEKLTFIGNPPDAVHNGANQRPGQRKAPPARPMLRIQATGAFGSTEVCDLFLQYTV
jgi:cell cycle checkpoint protein